MESVILSSPFLCVLYGLALLLGLIGLRKKKGMVLSFLSVVLCLSTTFYALIRGATFQEVAIVLLIFLSVNLITIFIERGSKQ